MKTGIFYTLSFVICLNFIQFTANATIVAPTQEELRMHCYPGSNMIQSDLCGGQVYYGNYNQYPYYNPYYGQNPYYSPYLNMPQYFGYNPYYNQYPYYGQQNPYYNPYYNQNGGWRRVGENYYTNPYAISNQANFYYQNYPQYYGSNQYYPQYNNGGYQTIGR